MPLAVSQGHHTPQLVGLVHCTNLACQQAVEKLLHAQAAAGGHVTRAKHTLQLLIQAVPSVLQVEHLHGAVNGKAPPFFLVMHDEEHNVEQPLRLKAWQEV